MAEFLKFTAYDGSLGDGDPSYSVGLNLNHLVSWRDGWASVVDGQDEDFHPKPSVSTIRELTLTTSIVIAGECMVYQIRDDAEIDRVLSLLA